MAVGEGAELQRRSRSQEHTKQLMMSDNTFKKTKRSGTEALHEAAGT